MNLHGEREAETQRHQSVETKLRQLQYCTVAPCVHAKKSLERTRTAYRGWLREALRQRNRKKPTGKRRAKQPRRETSFTLFPSPTSRNIQHIIHRDVRPQAATIAGKQGQHAFGSPFSTYVQYVHSVRAAKKAEEER